MGKTKSHFFLLFFWETPFRFWQYFVEIHTGKFHMYFVTLVWYTITCITSNTDILNTDSNVGSCVLIWMTKTGSTDISRQKNDRPTKFQWSESDDWLAAAWRIGRLASCSIFVWELDRDSDMCDYFSLKSIIYMIIRCNVCKCVIYTLWVICGFMYGHVCETGGTTEVLPHRPLKRFTFKDLLESQDRVGPA